MDNVVDCVTAVSRALEKFQIGPGAISHALEQARQAFILDEQQFIVHLERRINEIVKSPTGGSVEVKRDVDIIARDLVTRIHQEIKTGGRLSDAIDKGQLLQDAGLAIHNLMQREAKETAQTLQNVWRFSNIEFGERLPAAIRNNVKDLVTTLVKEGFSTEQIRSAISSFSFVDAAGKVIRAELTASGDLLFKDAMGNLFGPDGKVAQAATKAASNSPNFKPAMEALFGPSGKVAKEAAATAGEVNLQPAFENLENKIEKGVTGALNAAGNKAVKISAAELLDKVGSGLNALGNAISAIPALHKSLKDLGEAWDKPLKTTDDYMNLLSALGGTVSQFGSTLQAFAALTQVASAAQTVFNAVMAMNPVVLVVIAVVVLIAVIALLIVYWDKVKAVLRDNPWLAVVVAMTGVIGLIIVVIAYWDEIKLAVLKAANFISIQVQRIGYFFLGVGQVIGQVWDVVVASLANAGIAILNGFITIGVGIQNFFIGIINWIIDKYNALADSAIGAAAGLEKAAKLPEVDVNTKLIPPKEVPKVDVDAAFKTPDIKGGLEEQIAKQEEAVKKAQDADDKRRKEKAAKEAQPAPAPPGAPGVPGVPGAPGLPGTPGTLAVPGAPTVPGMAAIPKAPEPGAVTPPPIPAGPLPAPAAAAAAGPTNVTVNLGGVTVNVNADKLEANAAQMLSDEIVNALASRLGSLLAEQNFRTGTRPA